MLPGVDGRNATARRFRDICAAYEAEAGGNVTEVERDLSRERDQRIAEHMLPDDPPFGQSFCPCRSCRGNPIFSDKERAADNPERRGT